MRSMSQENSEFIESIYMLRDFRDKLFANEVKPQHFWGGKLSDGGSLIEAAYPPIKCELCPRAFAGPHRRRILAMHQRRVHGCGSRGKRGYRQERRGRARSQKLKQANLS
jgi:hypothetical protein